uniref:hypothetical protein n=1 Tax=Roseivirga sp. TaxID=1964215 RepID=UPI0040486655
MSRLKFKKWVAKTLALIVFLLVSFGVPNNTNSQTSGLGGHCLYVGLGLCNDVFWGYIWVEDPPSGGGGVGGGPIKPPGSGN